MARSSTSGLGRPRGVPNKATAEVKILAQKYTEAAIRRLAELGGLVEGILGAESPQAQREHEGPTIQERRASHTTGRS